jgi:O-antigen ligase
MISRSEAAWGYSGWIALAAVPVVVGLMVASSGGMVALGVIGLATAVLFFLRPEFGLLLAAATVPIENVFVFSGFTGTKIISAVALCAWLANRIVWRREWTSLLASRFVFVSTIFVAFALASLLWAMEPRVSYRGGIELAQYFAWALMIADLARSPAVITRLVRVLVLSGSAAAFFVVQQYLTGARRAGDQIAGGVNATATLLVTLVPLAFFLLRAEQRFLWRLLGAAYVGLAVAAVPVTLSRMNIMLLVVVLAVMSGLTLWGRRGHGWVLTLGAAAILIGVWLVPLEKISDRARTIGPYIQASLTQSAENPVSSGRGYHIRVGLAIARDNPIAGVGYRNYGYYFLRDYQFRVSGSEGMFYTVRSPHSSYVGILADLGIIGFVLWLILLFAVGVYYAFAAWTLSIRSRLENTRYLSESILVAFGLHALPYALYLPNQAAKIFWLLLAMTYAIHQIAISSVNATSHSSDARKRSESQVPAVSKVNGPNGHGPPRPTGALSGVGYT